MSVSRKLFSKGIRTGYLFFSQKPNYYNFISRSVRYANFAYYHSTINNNYIKTYWSLQKSCKLGTMAALSPLDPSSFSRPEIAIIKHISLFYDVIFEEKILHGVAELNFDILKPTRELILDVKDLTIHSIELKNGEQLKYEITDEVPNFGSKLTVNIPNCDDTCSKFVLRIKYTTSPNASALQWLSPSQTSGKTYPYMFSQCQPIHARSILPCQDTPAVKFTYEAEVVAPAHFTSLMSALRQEPTGNKTLFRQPVPIPSYLLAIAVAVLDHRRLGPRSLVWTEKEELEASAWEFAETEKYLQAAEALCGPYQWTQYDLLVLPPSFPYGGMENPCLTFVTPTLLAGDRSQADVIVHEIMHSWTGNLVTNRNFEHFWLNEGFTVFLERKVGSLLSADKEEGRKKRDFESIQGLSELQEAIQHFGSNNPLTNLVVDLKGVHPDDSFSRVPYEKGSLFLRYLEDLVGGPDVFDDFLRKYLSEFQRRSIDTDQFKELLLTYFNGTPNYDVLNNVDWDTWLNKSGMPPTIPNYDTSMTKQVNKFVNEINQSNNCSGDVCHLTARQMIYFLQQLLENPPLRIETLQSIGVTCNLSDNHNSEIKYRWLRLHIKSRNISFLNDVFEFINSQGRMKYVRPIYRDLYAWEEVRQQAIDNFLANEQFMMHVSAYTIRKDLRLQE